MYTKHCRASQDYDKQGSMFDLKPEPLCKRMQHNKKASSSVSEDCSKFKVTGKWQLHHTCLPYIHCADSANSGTQQQLG